MPKPCLGCPSRLSLNERQPVLRQRAPGLLGSTITGRSKTRDVYLREAARETRVSCIRVGVNGSAILIHTGGVL